MFFIIYACIFVLEYYLLFSLSPYFLGMKKISLFGLFLLLWFVLVWCWKGSVDKNLYPVAQEVCHDNDWEVTLDDEWVPICLLWGRGIYLADMEGVGEKFWEDSSLYPSAEQECIYNNGEVARNDNWEYVCVFSDHEFCYIQDIMQWTCEFTVSPAFVSDFDEFEADYQQYIAECYEQEQETVCWEDGIPYYNRCFMEKAWVKEETEMAEVVDGQCIYW